MSVVLTEKILKELHESVDYILYKPDHVEIFLNNSYVNFSYETRYLLKELEFEFTHPFLIKGTLFSAFYAFPNHVKPFDIDEFFAQHPNIKKQLNSEFPYLYPFQQKALVKALYNFHKGFPYFGLFWDVGVGKTVTSLSIAKKISNGNPVLVLAPKALLLQWAEEAEKFQIFNDIHILEKKRNWELHDLMLTTYETFRIDAPKYSSDFWKQFVIILDEASKIKNASAKVTRTVIRTFKDAYYKMALTATPYETSSLNVYNILRFLNDNIISPTLYLRAFSHTTSLTKIKLKNPLMLRHFLEFIGDFKQKHEVKDLPKLFIKDVFVEHTPAQKYVANYIASQTSSFFAIHTLLKVLDNSVKDLLPSKSPLVNNISSEINQLKKDTEKDEILLSFIEELYPRQILIFTQFKKTAYRLSSILKDKHHAVLHGNTYNKQQLIQDFKSNRLPILIATDAIAYGISFPQVNYLVNYDILYNPAKIHQRIGRIYRITSKYPKYVLNIIGGGIEKHTYNIVKQRWDDLSQLISTSEILVDALSSYLSELLNQPVDKIKQRILHELGKDSI